MSEDLKGRMDAWAESMAGCEHWTAKEGKEAKVWICGIEPGGGNSVDFVAMEILCDPDERECFYEKKEKTKFSWSQQHAFSRKIARAYAGYKGIDEKSLPKECERYDKDIFRVNLYPAAVARDTQAEWEKSGLDKLLGFDKKRDYKEWCKNHRFPYFADLRKKHKPELILCFGRQSESHFMDFVGSNTDKSSNACNTKSLGSIPPSRLGGPSNLRRFEVKLIDGETLFVCHAFPTYLSYGYLKKLGAILRRIRNKKVGRPQ